jgi:hypothetical protein
MARVAHFLFAIRDVSFHCAGHDVPVENETLKETKKQAKVCRSRV